MMVRSTAEKLAKRGVALCGAAILSLCVAGPAEAAVLELKPADTTCTTSDNTNLDGAGVLNIVDDCFGATGPLSLLYKSKINGEEDGTFASMYYATFTNNLNDPEAGPENGVIGQLPSPWEGPHMGCSACYLVVKDGNNTPAQYFFDISSWNGTDDIKLTNFWPQNGAISNVAIWGRAEQVPEPTTLLLFGTAFGFLSLKRRRFAR